MANLPVSGLLTWLIIVGYFRKLCWSNVRYLFYKYFIMTLSLFGLELQLTLLFIELHRRTTIKKIKLMFLIPLM